MIIGYSQGVNKIVIISNEGKRITKKLGVKGLNICGEEDYTYYDIYYQLHYLDMSYIQKIKLYNDKELICELFGKREIKWSK
jgi:hypothetical protein